MKKIEKTSYAEAIEERIAELEALKNIISHAEAEIERYREIVSDYERQIEESEADGIEVESWDWRRDSIRENRVKISALKAVVEKLMK